MDCPYCSLRDVAARSYALLAVANTGAAQVPDHEQDRRKNSEVYGMNAIMKTRTTRIPVIQ